MSRSSAGDQAPGTVRDLLARINDAWRAFMATLEDIPEERMEEGGVVGEWSLKSLFGHMAFWDDQALQNIDLALAGRPERHDDWQAMNEADHAARLGRSLPEERTAMHQAHAALIERLEGVAGLEATAIDEAIKGSSYEHYAEHTVDVREWRTRAGVQDDQLRPAF